MKKEKSKEKNYNGKKPIWVIALITVTAVDVFLLTEYFWIKRFPLTGSLFGLLVITDILIWGIVGIAFTEKKSMLPVIDEKELDNAKRLLRYATAILSFLSLMTTANGMKSFVFDTDWKAYFGSFAVQSILVVFSLLLCHFYVIIGTLSNLSRVGKSLMLGALTLFFSTALVVSSSFSFVYISGNAYKDTWTGDCETLIQEYLIRETNALRTQNTHLGKLFLEDIGNNIQQTLETDVKIYWDQKEVEVKEKISHFQMESYPDAADDIQKIDITPTIENLGRARNAQPEELAEIQNSYNVTGLDAMQRAFVNYDTIANTVSHSLGDDLDSVQDQLHKTSEKLQEILDNVDNAIEGIDNLRTGFYVNDINPIKSTFRSIATRFKSFVQTQKDQIDALITEVSNVNDNTIDSGETSVTNQIETIRREIYLLTPQQSNLNSTLQEVVKNISELLDQLSTSDMVTTESVASLTSLTEKINEYGKSLSLSNNIQSYLQNNLGQTYSFSGDYGVAEDTWRVSRDDDFHEFLSMLHNLPDPLFLDDAYRSSYEQGEYRNTADILKEAGILRRDLLGKLTEFERSLNYFKYDFRKMAFFSAFIAVFLDLGAFLTGCFLYSTRQIQIGQAEFKSTETNPEEENDSKPDEQQHT